MPLERLRIFISSPGDVAEERVLANNLVRRLSDEFEEHLRIEPVFWEHEPLLATSTFQKQIPPPRECEVAICILWSRIGWVPCPTLAWACASTMQSVSALKTCPRKRGTWHPRPHALPRRQSADSFLDAALQFSGTAR